MNKKEYEKLIEEFTKHRRGVSNSKRKDYTKGNEDVLANFKNVAESTGISPLQVWLVYTQKHFDAISNYVRTKGQEESEPILERFGDLSNYLELGWGLIKEREDQKCNSWTSSVIDEGGETVGIVVTHEPEDQFLKEESGRSFGI